VRGTYRDEEVFLGCAFTSGLEKVVVPFFDKGTPVEYELIRSVCTAAQQKRKRLGVLTTDADLFGGFDMTTGQQRPRQAIVDELEKQYDVVQVDASAPITEKYDVLLAVQPSSLGPEQMAHLVAAVAAGQPVVVRRAACASGWVAVGVRGQGREQRLGVQMRVRDIQRQLTPESLRGAGQSPWPALRALVSVAPVLDACGLVWGPTGGVGYQLATGCNVVHDASDLDLLVRAPQLMDRAKARELLDILDCGPCRIDVQLETPAGAVALREWAGLARRVLLKSAHGARLVADPWNALECAA
jgi:phosphoribosyl-dephospho-CoA transferase